MIRMKSICLRKTPPRTGVRPRTGRPGRSTARPRTCPRTRGAGAACRRAADNPAGRMGCRSADSGCLAPPASAVMREKPIKPSVSHRAVSTAHVSKWLRVFIWGEERASLLTSHTKRKNGARGAVCRGCERREGGVVLGAGTVASVERAGPLLPSQSLAGGPSCPPTHPMHGIHVPKSLYVNVHSNFAHSRPNLATPAPPCP